MPTMVQNATLSHVILDCIYSLNHSEKDGMILKWYFNGKTIFQWIPPSKPKVRDTAILNDCFKSAKIFILYQSFLRNAGHSLGATFFFRLSLVFLKNYLCKIIKPQWKLWIFFCKKILSSKSLKDIKSFFLNCSILENSDVTKYHSISFDHFV